MRSQQRRTLALARVLALVVLAGAPARSRAQMVVAPALPGGHVQPYPPSQGWGVPPQRNPIPRTYSYYYNRRFNQPRHFRYVGPDRRTYWGSSVRGLPLGTPWLGR